MKLRLQRVPTLKLYDTWNSTYAPHIAGLTGLVGESMCAGVLLHYFRQTGFDAEIVPGTPTTGRRGQPWLDCWIKVQNAEVRRIYQVEIKNWSAYSLGGEDLGIDPSDEEYARYAKRRWRVIVRPEGLHEAVAKVGMKMRVPDDFAAWEHRSLACFWFCLHPDGSREPYFAMQGSPDFPQIEVFSVSAYLRSLKDAELELALPIVEQRMALFAQLFGQWHHVTHIGTGAPVATPVEANLSLT